MADLDGLVRRLIVLWHRIQVGLTFPADAPSNCLLWALQQQAQHGGALILLPSTYGPWYHVQWWAPDGTVREFSPLAPKVQQVTLPTLFEGHELIVGRLTTETE